MRHEKLYLQDIVEAVGAIERFIKGVSKDDFFVSDLLQSAVLQKLMIIGEAAANLSSELKSHYPQVPWKQIIGFRNIAVHAYFSMNWEIVWVAATKNAPALREQILVIFRNSYPDFESKNKE